jgi:serine/threonine-protein kinase
LSVTDRDDPWLAAGVREGEILAGKYRVERVLGVGGMGVVVAAHHVHLDQRVAIKFLRPEMTEDPQIAARFAREARAAVRIKCEQVARVADVGTLPNGAPFMVMEYLDGEDLSVWLRKRGPLPIEQAVDFVLQACVALAEAHALGIVHRDLKPSNLYCVQRMDGQLGIKVLDFGISKMADPAGAVSATRTHALMGSPHYMSPEQMRSAKDVNAQTDIWSLGVMLFELLSGRPAFLGDSVTELAIVVATQPTPSIRALRRDAPEGLETVLLKCLEKDRRLRYANVAELAMALLPFAPARSSASVERIVGIVGAAGQAAPVGAAARPTGAMAHTMLAPETLPPVGRTAPETSRRRVTLGGAVAGASLVLLVAAAVFFVARQRKAEHEESTPAAAVWEKPAAAPPAVLPAATLEPATPPPRESTPAEHSERAEASAPAAAKVAAQPPAPSVATAAKPPHAPGLVSPAGAASNGGASAHSAPAGSAAGRCDPPYYFDDHGNRLFKKDCL